MVPPLQHILQILTLAIWKVGCSKPNVVFFLADDWGFNDVGYHFNTNTKTPFIDELALSDSLIVDKFYGMPLCTITRCALLTGRHPMRFGLQDSTISYESNYALSKQEVLLSEEFKQQGYTTHIVGKWHLGMMHWDYTPLYRGFDSFMGYYGGELYYYSKMGEDSNYKAYDLRVDDDPVSDINAHDYSLDIFAKHTLNLVDLLAETPESPFFLYLPWQGSHVPAEAKDEYLQIYEEGLNETQIDNSYNRLIFQAQTTQTDDVMELLVARLKDHNLWENTLFVFCSDNGADLGHGDNSPLRGGKSTIWDGGVRIPMFLTGGFLPDPLRGKLFDRYPLHVTDVFPTLLSAAGLGRVQDKNPIDGMDLWGLLQTASNARESRTAFETALQTHGASVHDTYLQGLDASATLLEAFEGTAEEFASLTDERVMLINVDDSSCDTAICGSLILGGRWKLIYGNVQVDSHCAWERTFEASTNDIYGCGGIPQDVDLDCSCASSVCLFDILTDPCEYYDVSEEHPELTQKLYNKLAAYYEVQVEALVDSIGDVSDVTVVDPTNADGSTGFWGPWAKAEDWRTLHFEIMLSVNYRDSADLKLFSESDVHVEMDAMLAQSEESEKLEHLQKMEEFEQFEEVQRVDEGVPGVEGLGRLFGMVGGAEKGQVGKKVIILVVVGSVGLVLCGVYLVLFVKQLNGDLRGRGTKNEVNETSPLMSINGANETLSTLYGERCDYTVPI